MDTYTVYNTVPCIFLKPVEFGSYNKGFSILGLVFFPGGHMRERREETAERHTKRERGGERKKERTKNELHLWTFLQTMGIYRATDKS